jgi:hypothetical protein
VIQIPVTFQVREPVQVSPRSIFLNNLTRGEIRTIDVAIDMPEQWAANVEAVRPSANWIRVTDAPKVLRNGSTLQVHLEANELPKTFNGTLVIQTDHPAIGNVIIPIYGFVSE